MIRAKDFFRIVLRESLLGLCIGFILAWVGLVRVMLQQSNWLLSISVGVSMGLTIMLAAVVGAALPLISRRLKCDPAIMSGPLITTIVDVVGILIYFEIARFVLSLNV
jgi:magnesium transporter